ncbi:hypothetical protein HA466_0214630 [Hirschfeldia incana]|nr:hypothetical protein HA466_0214630 [Hirschfeldia incana]
MTNLALSLRGSCSFRFLLLYPNHLFSLISLTTTEKRRNQHRDTANHKILPPDFGGALRRDNTMSSVEDAKEQGNLTNDAMPSTQQEEAAVKNKYGGLMPKKPPLISKDHERAYFDSADWALGKQGVAKPKGPLEALRPKLQPTQQQTRYRKSPCAPSGEDGGAAQGE